MPPTTDPHPQPADRLSASPARRRAHLPGQVLLAGLILGLALMLGWMGAELALSGTGPLAGALMGLVALWLAGAAAVMLLGALELAGLPDPVLDIDPEGLLDRRLGPRRIAWSDLDWERVRITTTFTDQDLVRIRLAAPYPLRPSARAMAALGRVLPLPMFRDRALFVTPLGPQATTDRIALAMARHRPPMAPR